MKKTTPLLLLLIAVLFLPGAIFAGEVIKVGVPLAMTGPYADTGENYWRGIKMAIDEINANGGLLGKQLVPIRFDTQEFSPERVMQGADYLVGKEKVASVHAGWAGWGQDVRAYGKYDVPFFADDGSQAAVDVFRENPKQYSNIFQLTDTDINQATSMFNVLMALPYEYPNKKVVIINADDSWGTGVGDTLEARFKEAGWEVALRQTVPYGTREWGPILTRIRRIRPAIIHVEIVSAPEVITFFRQFMNSPTNSILSYGYSIVPREVLETLGAEGDGLIGEVPTAMPTPEAPTPEAQAWVDRFTSIWGSQPQAGSWAAYSGVKAWAAAVEAVGDEKNYAAVNHYIASNGYKGETGWWKWDEDHVMRGGGDVPFGHYQVQNGTMVTIFTDPPVKPYKHFKFIKPRWIQ
ncbi:MAG: Extracellular ligand-binding receptor [Desulfomicrobiaceae bacterium]|nr:ABC transporter substrate-binding protein [Acetomicrobium sp.]MBZ4685264.1 Extracellular ligand-binding receptor [Desulfomicrobiaceae bacterium]